MTTMTSRVIEEASAEEFIDPKPPGMGPFGKIGSVMLITALVMTGVLMKLTVWYVGLAFGVIAFPLLAAATIRNPLTGDTRMTKWNTRRTWRKGERKGTNQHVAGPISALGNLLLPGFLAQSKLTEARATDNSMFGLVEIPSTDDYGVTFKAHPDGASLLADETLLRFAHRWGKALKFLCNEPGAIQAAVTVRTAPDPGNSERDRILSSIRTGASDYSRMVMMQLAEQTPPGAAIVDSFVTLTFEADHAGTRRTTQVMSDELAPRLPQIAKRLTDGGAGHCTLMTAQDITDAVQAAYDPSSARHIAKMRTAGLETGTKWEAIGPPRADNRWDCYRHAGAVTVAWTMTDIEGAVNLTTLEPLIRADAHCDVKEVTLVYRLRTPAEKHRLAQKTHRNARFHTSKTDPTSQDAKREASASKTATDTARGEGLVDIAVIITACVLDKVETVVDDDGNETTSVTAAVDRVPAMVAAVEQSAPQAMLAITRQYGGNAATKAAGTPCLPIVCSHHSKLTPAMQEDL